MVRIHQQNSNQYLESNYTPSGLISDPDIAMDVFINADLSMPSMESPAADLDKWREFVDVLTPEVITELGEMVPFYEESQFFKALSIKVDEETPYDVTDLVKITLGPKEQEKDKPNDTVAHIERGYEYVLKVLPPVTSGMVGSWLGEIRAFDNHYYKDEFLPGDYSWGGLHYPRRGEIQMTTDYWYDFTDDVEYPSKSNSSTSTLLHEIGHTVHNIYGFHRPGDSGYAYPSGKHTIVSTGMLPQTNLTTRQEEFIMEIIRSYALNQRDAFKNIHYTGYGTTHPAESFACAFDVLLRQGGPNLRERYEQYNDLFSLMV